MKEELYTIPVMDGFKKNCECAFCAMAQEAESKVIGFIMSPSYMETDVRDRTNALGFCKPHTEKLYAQKNALGLALMMQSHLSYQRKELDRLLPNSSSGGLLRRKSNDSPVKLYREKLSSSCYICEQVKDTMDRYLKTFFYLLKKSNDFAETVWTSPGFCLDHFLLLYDRSADFLSGNSLLSFRNQLVTLENKNLDRLEEELDWFIKKFDYRYREEPWKNSKDALPRSILKINGQWPEK